jgi:hypothetical protein
MEWHVWSLANTQTEIRVNNVLVPAINSVRDTIRYNEVS